MSAPRAGWYRDPAGTPDSYRWWDGSGWTEHLSASASAPAPAADDVVPRELAEADETPRRPRSTARRVVAAVVVIALFASTGIGIGLLLWSGPTMRDTDSPRGPAASPQVNGGQLDERTRTATIGSASMTLPDDPYALQTDPVALQNLFAAAFTAEAVVHADYAGRDDWSSMVALAAVDPVVFSGDDLGVGAQAALVRLSALLYGTHPSISDVDVADRAVDGHSGVQVTAKIHYEIPRLPSSYDTVTAVFVRLDDGTVVAAMTSVPDDAADPVRDQAQRSLATLTVS